VSNHGDDPLCVLEATSTQQHLIHTERHLVVAKTDEVTYTSSHDSNNNSMKTIDDMDVSPLLHPSDHE
jgi:hypothetical protein